MVDLWKAATAPGIARRIAIARRERRAMISLRLASQLFAGLVLVYSRQVHHLFRMQYHCYPIIYKYLS